MADKDKLYPDFSQLLKPDGSVYVYAQSCMDLSPLDYIEQLPTGRVKKFTGGPRLPKGLVSEVVPKDYYTWVMVKEPNPPEVKHVEVSPEQLRKLTNKPQVG